jgi:lipoprotein-anchoring transpeptidase ErfK/SrfK
VLTLGVSSLILPQEASATQVSSGLNSHLFAVSTSEAPKQTKSSSRRKSARKGRSLVLEAQQMLADMGYWTGPVDGVAGQRFRDCLVAFQKVEGRQRTGRLTRAEFIAIREANRPVPTQGGPFHVEIDLSRQVLFVVDDDGVVTRILPVSTGNDEWFTSKGWTRRAYTPCGRFRVFGKIEGWRKSDLGLLYYPNYIAGGIAIHGSPSVPAYPASHGCVRIPMYAARDFSEMTPVGVPVIVHGGTDPDTDRIQGICRTSDS